MKYFYFFLIYMPFVIASSAEIQCDHILYEDNILVLEGNLLIEHSIGKISGNIAKIDALHLEDTTHCKKAILEGNVSFTMETGKTFYCDRAIFDFANREAYLFANDGRIEFHDKEHSLSLWGTELSCSWDYQNQVLIKTMHFLGDVSLDYASEIHLSTDGEIIWDQQDEYCMIINDKKPIRATYKDASIDSKAAFISLKDHTPQAITFVDHVSLKKDNMMLYAEKMQYFPEEKAIEIISSEESHLVLKDMEETFSLTGTRIVFTKDPETKQAEFQATGAVDISCDAENYQKVLESIQVWIQNLF